MKTKYLKIFLFFLFGIAAQSCNFIKIMNSANNENIIIKNGPHKFTFEDNQIIINTIFSDGIKRNFLLDIGAPINTVFIDSSMINLIKDKIPLQSFGKSSSADGTSIKRKYLPWRNIKANLFEIENSFLSSITRPDPFACNKINGIWGAELFSPESKGHRNKLLLIRMQDSTVAVLDSLPPLENWTQIVSKFTIFSHIKLKINIGCKSNSFFLDTGFSGSVLMTRETYLAAQKIFDKKQTYGYITNTLSGSQIDTAYTGKFTLDLGRGILTDSVFVISTRASTVNAIGMEFIKRFNMLIDYQNKELYLQPNPNYINQKKSFFDCKGFKALNMDNNKITILNLTVNSPAEKAGLKIGDQILSINNIIANESDNCEVEKLFKELDGNFNNNEIVVKRGNETLKFTL